MATFEIRDETYEQLAKRAALEQTAVEAFVQPALDRLARGEAIASIVGRGAWSSLFRMALRMVQSRARSARRRYPIGRQSRVDLRGTRLVNTARLCGQGGTRCPVSRRDGPAWD